ncbi:MAG: nuclease-related domain-containing protein, partial [Betaproteobacteria bacterium]
MATLFPVLSGIKGASAGERRFAARLESHLEDDYLCWYNVRVGAQGRYPDFVLFHPRRGLLIIEVKDWKR